MMIVSLCLLLVLPLATVFGDLSWENCDGRSNDIKLVKLVINPHPISLPGSVSIQVTIQSDQDIISPVKATLALKRKMLFGSVPLPCVNGIGSCTYDDLCTLCQQCGCPLKAGEHTLTLPVTIDTSSWTLAGNYQGELNLQTSSGQKACVKVNNVHIKSTQ